MSVQFNHGHREELLKRRDEPTAKAENVVQRQAPDPAPSAAPLLFQQVLPTRLQTAVQPTPTLSSAGAAAISASPAKCQITASTTAKTFATVLIKVQLVWSEHRRSPSESTQQKVKDANAQFLKEWKNTIVNNPKSTIQLSVAKKVIDNEQADLLFDILRDQPTIKFDNLFAYSLTKTSPIFILALLESNHPISLSNLCSACRMAFEKCDENLAKGIVKRLQALEPKVLCDKTYFTDCHSDKQLAPFKHFIPLIKPEEHFILFVRFVLIDCLLIAKEILQFVNASKEAAKAHPSLVKLYNKHKADAQWVPTFEDISAIPEIASQSDTLLTALRNKRADAVNHLFQQTLVTPAGAVATFFDTLPQVTSEEEMPILTLTSLIKDSHQLLFREICRMGTHDKLSSGTLLPRFKSFISKMQSFGLTLDGFGNVGNSPSPSNEFTEALYKMDNHILYDLAMMVIEERCRTVINEQQCKAFESFVFDLFSSAFAIRYQDSVLGLTTDQLIAIYKKLKSYYPHALDLGELAEHVMTGYCSPDLIDKFFTQLNQSAILECDSYLRRTRRCSYFGSYIVKTFTYISKRTMPFSAAEKTWLINDCHPFFLADLFLQCSESPTQFHTLYQTVWQPYLSEHSLNSEMQTFAGCVALLTRNEDATINLEPQNPSSDWSGGISLDNPFAPSLSSFSIGDERRLDLAQSKSKDIISDLITQARSHPKFLLFLTQQMHRLLTISNRNTLFLNLEAYQTANRAFAKELKGIDQDFACNFDLILQDGEAMKKITAVQLPPFLIGRAIPELEILFITQLCQQLAKQLQDQSKQNVVPTTLVNMCIQLIAKPDAPLNALFFEMLIFLFKNWNRDAYASIGSAVKSLATETLKAARTAEVLLSPSLNMENHFENVWQQIHQQLEKDHCLLPALASRKEHFKELFISLIFLKGSDIDLLNDAWKSLIDGLVEEMRISNFKNLHMTPFYILNVLMRFDIIRPRKPEQTAAAKK